MPAAVYGPGQPSQNLKVKLSEFERVYKQAGASDLVMLEIDGQAFNVLIHEVDGQQGRYLHVAFLQVRMDKTLEVDIPLHFVGEAPAIDLGGLFFKEADTVRVECLPRDLVHAIEVDLSNLTGIGSAIRMGELKLPPGMALVTDPEELVAHIVAPTAEEEPAPAEAEAPKEAAQPEEAKA